LDRAHIPLYATADAEFPGGFEVGITGESGGRQIMVRKVLAAQGAFQKPRFSDLVTITNTRDIW